VFFSVRGGGVATANTPNLVRYYLEQAYKAQAASAYSAALAMYRAALQQLLKDKGFEGKLPTQLTKLNKDIQDGVAPSWAKRLNTDALTVIKEICNSHAHPSELPKLQALDTAFMSKIQRTFSSLLSTAYEQEPRRAAAKEKLKAALQKSKKTRTKPP
jgi:tetratricopeptide (TPR) repeat protein